MLSDFLGAKWSTRRVCLLARSMHSEDHDRGPGTPTMPCPFKRMSERRPSSAETPRAAKASKPLPKSRLKKEETIPDSDGVVLWLWLMLETFSRKASKTALVSCSTELLLGHEKKHSHFLASSDSMLSLTQLYASAS